MPASAQSPPGRSFVLQTSQGSLTGFPLATLYDWSPLGYLVVGRNDEYAVSYRGAQDPTAKLSRDLPRIPLGPEERAEWEALNAAMGQWYREAGAKDVAMRPLPDIKPVFREIQVGDDGRIWVDRYVRATQREVPRRSPDLPPFTWREPATSTSSNPPACSWGTVVLPQDTRILVWRGNRMWGIHLDTEDVERVVRLRIEPTSSQLPVGR